MGKTLFWRNRSSHAPPAATASTCGTGYQLLDDGGGEMIETTSSG